MTLLLLEDPYSPLYSEGAPGALRLHVRTVLDCLLGDRQTGTEAGRTTSRSIEGTSHGVR
jgi:hypothetical protein